MANLDDLFRRSQRTVRPATPPAGQWERIARGLEHEPERRRGGSFLWGVLFGLLLAGVPAAYLSRASAPVYPVQVVDNPAPAPAGYGTPLHSAAPPPVRQIITVYDTVRVVEYQTVVTDRPNRALTFDLLALLRTNPFSFPAFAIPDGARLPVSVSPIATGKWGKVTSRYADDGLDPLALRGLKPVQVRLEPRTPDLGWRGFTQIKKSEPLRGRWEIGVHLTPQVLSGGEGTGQIYFDTPGDNGSEFTLNLNGAERTVYDRDYETDVPLSTKPRIRFTHLQVARQFSSGIRIGIGFGFKHEAAALPRRSELESRIGAGNYLSYNKIKNKEYLGTLNLSYTFWRRQRWQLGVGILASSYLDRNSEGDEYVYSIDGRRYYKVGRSYNGGNPGPRLYRHTLLPQLTLHYHLNDRLSVGTELAPGLGLGARYKLY